MYSFDELKNQWRWGGYTAQDLGRCQIMARMNALVADPKPDILLVLEGEASQVAEAAAQYFHGVDVEPSDDRILTPRKDEGGGSTAVFRLIGT